MFGVTVLDPMSDRPLFQQLADHLRDQLDSGRYQPGDQLPTQAALCDEHGVSISVVREAIDVLRVEGRVESFRGRGVLVRTPPVRRVLSSGRYARQLSPPPAGDPATSAFLEELQAEIADLSMDCVFGVAPAPTVVAAEFGIEPGAPAYRRQMTWLVEGTPKRSSDSWFPLDLVEGTPMMDPRRQPWPGGVIAELVALGLRFGSVDEDIVSRPPTPAETYALRIPGGTSIFVLTRVGRAWRPGDPTTDPPRVVEHATQTLPCDRWALHNRLDF